MSDLNLYKGTDADCFESALVNEVNGTGLNISPTLITWTENIIISGVKWAQNSGSITGGNALFHTGEGYLPLEMYLRGNNPPSDSSVAKGPANGVLIPKIGDYHRAYQTNSEEGESAAVVTNVSIDPQTHNATTDLRVRVAFAMPGKNSEVSYDVYQQTEVRNFAEDTTGTDAKGKGTRVTFVPYFPTAAAGQALAQNTMLLETPLVLDVNVPVLIRAMTITQYEIIKLGETTETQIQGGAGPTPIGCSQMAGYSRPVWNSENFLGFPAGTLLFIGCPSQTDGSGLYRRQYRFLINQYGWHHFYGVALTSEGKKPADIVPINPLKISPGKGTYSRMADPDGGIAAEKYNGVAAFRMLPSLDFRTVFKGLKPPIDQNTNIAFEDPTLDDTKATQGVYP